MLRRLLSTLLSAALLAAAPLATSSAQDTRAPAPAFSGDTLDGGSVALADYAGQVVVVSFWATWCRPCLQELPHLDGFYRQFRDQGLVVLAVTNDGPETLSQVRTIVERFDWAMPIVLDQDGALTTLLNPPGVNPYVVFIDRAGRIAHTHAEYSPGDEAAHLERIQALLAEPAP